MYLVIKVPAEGIMAQISNEEIKDIMPILEKAQLFTSNYQTGGYQYTADLQRNIEIELFAEGSPRIHDNKPEVFAKTISDLQAASSKQRHEKWELEKKVKELEAKIKKFLDMIGGNYEAVALQHPDS